MAQRSATSRVLPAVLPAVLAALAACAPAAFAAADRAQLARGQQLYGQCAACHAVARHGVGPAHCGVFGRRAGTAAGFERYSAAMKRSGLVWDDETLARFVAAPGATVPGTTMAYLGLPDAQDRDALLAWLRQAARPGRACTPPQAAPGGAARAQ